MFGHERGAFTGAEARRLGRFEQAGGGTLFLDEIDDLAPETQAKLLRVLQERVISRVGGRESIPVDVRIVAATHRDLPALVATGKFREDLWYRLNVIAIPLPPLRERREDIPALGPLFHGALCAEALQEAARQPDTGAVNAMVTRVERELPVQAHAATSGYITQMGLLLGWSRLTVREKLTFHGLRRESGGDSNPAG